VEHLAAKSGEEELEEAAMARLGGLTFLFDDAGEVRSIAVHLAKMDQRISREDAQAALDAVGSRVSELLEHQAGSGEAVIPWAKASE
jgi:hypothetical protein